MEPRLLSSLLPSKAQKDASASFARRVKDDNRGAIMVLGIFFACIMIGWMWMLVGLGDAMIWRDRSQEAADAITYSSAAVQAKAMNLISFVNIVMMIIAGVYLLLAMVYNVLDLAHIILGSTNDGYWILPSSCSARADEMAALGDALDATGYGAVLGVILNALSDVWCPAAGAVQGIHSGVGTVLGGAETVMADVLPALSTFEDVVSYAAPWAGAATGTYVGTKYVDWGQKRIGVPLSATLIPATFTPGQAGSFPAKKYKAEADPACESASQASSCQEFNGGDKREGLPVEIPDDGMSALCKAAATTVIAPVAAYVEKIPFIGSLLGWVLDGVADSLEEDYCHKDSLGLFHSWEEPLTYALQAVTLIPLGGLDNNETCPKDDWGVSGGGSGELGIGGPGTCNGVYQVKKGSEPFWENPIKVGGPHTLVGYAGNGGDWFQVWSFVYGGNRVEQSEKKVAVAGMDSKQGSSTW
ncbi:MAG TPA: hypothetical protein VLM85_01080, partial [Polyangiaceae bacterium]|nr:hypothetical protein [Polyangiaceae bacterium]